MAAPPTADDVPAALTDQAQWVAWREQERSGKLTKVPVNPHTGGFASTTDPDSWGTFTEARDHAVESSAEGIGFVFSDDDPFVGVDLDDCRVPETGTLTEDAAAIVDRLDSYTEVSPSGTGVHVLVRGTLPEGRNRKGDVELYETARFFTVTGAHVDGTPETVERRPDALASVHSEYLQPETTTTPGAADSTSDDDSEADTAGDAAAETSSPTESAPEPSTGRDTDGDGSDASAASAPTESESTAGLSDEELIERAKNAANGEKFTRLWRGDTAGYESHSEADMALCALLAFWTGGDRAQLDRLFRQSGLMREKWDERHYADGSTYGEKTIERVLASTDEFYDPGEATDDGAGTDVTPAADTATQTDAAADQPADGTEAALRDELRALRERERELLALVDDLEAKVEQLEAENDRLRDEIATDSRSSEERSPSVVGRWLRRFRKS